MSTTTIGREAESFVANYFIKKKFTILSQNWRTPRCEVDIIAQKKRCIYFIEVRYRKQNTWGDGIDSITAKKYHQIRYSAEIWLAENDWSGDVSLYAVSVSGYPFNIDAIVEL